MPETTKTRTTHLGRVTASEWITPHMRRVVLGGEGLSEFATAGFTDAYVKLLFPPDGGDFDPSFDFSSARKDIPHDQRPVTRTYTVRKWDKDAQELTIDFVHHGPAGIAGPWAAHAEIGTQIPLLGPGGGYAPDAGADWHLLAGDESALPAIATAIEALATDAKALAYIEVADKAEQQDISAPEGVEIHWLHRGNAPVGAKLVEAVSAATFLPGSPQIFIHGEATFVKELRRQVLVVRGVPRTRVSISGYWTLGANEDTWRTMKADWNRDVEAQDA